ncbi:MAG: hypothetical protein ABI658_28370 [Acidimicrobiales bacterium]
MSAASTTAATPPPTTSVATTATPTSVTTTREVVGRVRALASSPNAARGPSAVWSGQVLYAWFGTAAGAYTPSTDVWSTLPTPNLSTRTDAIVAWTASMLVVWGGPDANGARFDPTSGAWRAVAAAPITSRTRTWSAFAASDRELYVWGGANADGSVTAEGAAYDPVADRWRLLPAAPIEGRSSASAVWSGSELILWGGTTTPAGNAGGRSDGAAYNPKTDTWRVLARSPLSAGITSAVWNGREVLYGPTRSGDANGTFASTTAAAYDPATDAWRRLDLHIGHPGFLSGWDGEHLVLFAKGGGVAVDLRTGTPTDIADDLSIPTNGAIVSTEDRIFLLGDGKLVEYTR